MSLEGHNILFFLAWPMTIGDGQFDIGICFPSFFFIQLLRKMHDCFFYFLYSNFNHYFLSFYFCSYLFYKSFIYFQISFSIIIICYFFHFGPYFFNFFLCSFVKVLLVFNYIIRSKFMLFYFFQIDSFFYLLFILLKLFFVSI